ETFGLHISAQIIGGAATVARRPLSDTTQKRSEGLKSPAEYVDEEPRHASSFRSSKRPRATVKGYPAGWLAPCRSVPYGLGLHRLLRHLALLRSAASVATRWQTVAARRNHDQGE